MKLDKAFLEKTDENIGEIQTIVGTLKKLANEDDKITDDEKTLLENIQKNLTDYSDLLEKVIEDGVIDQGEYDKMKSFELKVVQDAQQEAFKDGDLSDDELAILKKLTDLLTDIGTLEFKK